MSFKPAENVLLAFTEIVMITSYAPYVFILVSLTIVSVYTGQYIFGVSQRCPRYLLLYIVVLSSGVRKRKHLITYNSAFYEWMFEYDLVYYI
jgi:hypothetical protein